MISTCCSDNFIPVDNASHRGPPLFVGFLGFFELGIFPAPFLDVVCALNSDVLYYNLLMVVK
jgi:hypothetical protein